ncbi:MAG: glycosyltransferase family 2 protein [Gammaproteobacteria bacterium]
MKISVITVAFNAVSTIEETICSVQAQNYSDIEHIIVDGCSTDGTLEIIEKCIDKQTRLISEPDEGIYDAMNKGLSLASGDVVGFLNADDFYPNESVLGDVAKVFLNENIDACYGDLVYVSNQNPTKIVRYWKSSSFSIGLFRKGWCPPHPTFFVRSLIYKKYGGFDLKYKMGNDVELMMRFMERYKIKSIYLSKVLVKMRMGGVSNKSIKNIVKQNIEILQAAENNNISMSPFSFLYNKIKSRIAQLITRG